MTQLSPPDLAIYGGARSLADWHARHRFCARCGSATKLVKGGWQRHCETCGADHFPRTDPVVIMLAEHDGRALVGRGRGWPPGRYSALAGFVEPGERLVDAVAREVFEEVGLEVGDIVHHADQPWPFPGSLMIGFTARARSAELTLDPREIAEARWVSRAEVPGLLASGAWRYRGRSSISGRLIEHWYGGPLPT